MCFCPRQETDAQGAQRGDGHQEVLVQGLAVGDGLRGLPERLPSRDEVGDEVKEQVLPGFPVRIAFDQDGCGEQRGRQDDAEDVAAVPP